MQRGRGGLCFCGGHSSVGAERGASESLLDGAHGDSHGAEGKNYFDDEEGGEQGEGGHGGADGAQGIQAAQGEEQVGKGGKAEEGEVLVPLAEPAGDDGNDVPGGVEVEREDQVLDEVRLTPAEEDEAEDCEEWW